MKRYDSALRVAIATLVILNGLSICSLRADEIDEKIAVEYRHYDISLQEIEAARSLALPEAVSLTLQQNLNLQAEALTPDIIGDRIRAAKGRFDPEFTLNYRVDAIHTPQSVQEFIQTGGDAEIRDELKGTPRIFQEDNTIGRVGLVGQLPFGTEYEIGVHLDELENDLTRDSALSLFSPEYRSYVGLSITQPLLKNFGLKANMIEVLLGRKTRDIANLTLRQRALEAVGMTLRNYHECVLSYNDVLVRRDEVRMALRLAAEKSIQLERGTLSEGEVDRFEQALAESYEKLLLSKQIYLIKSTALTASIGDTMAISAGSLYRAAYAEYAKVPELNRVQLFELALENNSAYLAAMQEVEKQNIEVRYYKNQMLPQIDLEGSFGYNGIAADYNEAFSEATGGQAEEFTVGIAIRVPLSFATERAHVREAKKLAAQALLRVKQRENEVVIQIDRILRSMEIHKMRLAATQRSLDLAGKALSSREDRLEKGSTTPLAVMESRQRVRSAELRRDSAKVDLPLGLIDLWIVTGDLLSKL